MVHVYQSKTKLVRFPTGFTIQYSAKNISQGATYTLQATVENKKKQLLYTNDVRIRVTPVGADRTKSIDVSVIQVESFKSKMK